MAKSKTVFVCNNCGVESGKWIGKCPACSEWNTYTEVVLEKESRNNKSSLATKEKAKKNKPKKLTDVVVSSTPRRVFADLELNRVLGGGLVSGSIVLLGGEPGIGKSTLLLQTMAKENNTIVAYVSGEESEQQVKMRAERLGLSNEQFYLLTETSTRKVLAQLKRLQPEIVIIDSIQTLYSDYLESTPGTVSQIRECAGEFQRYAKENNVPVLIIGHITKDGAIAGPKLLEHMVDTVLQFEGDTNYNYRIVRTLKNRFGSTAELGIYEMRADGLRPVSNPSELLISNRDEDVSGVSISSSVEGLRPMLIETQALVSTSVYGTPQRTSTGFDQKRLNMLLAILEKRAGYRFGASDVFVNIVGGIKTTDPSIDLAIAVALVSSFTDIAVPSNVCFAGEMGLSGEVRNVTRVEQRILEADKLGFKKIVISGNNKISIKNTSIEIVELSKLEAVLQYFF